MTKKLNVAVLFGGKSQEHEVSLMSATNIINAMDKNKYNIYKIGITKQGKWMVYNGSTDKIMDGSWEKEIEVDTESYCQDDETLFSRTIKSISNIEKLDVVFPVLHGPYGEDGTVQGLLEVLDVPYVGCGVMGSAIGMDKQFSKLLFEKFGIPIGNYKVYYKHNINGCLQNVVMDIEKNFTYPFFIKPANMGSSVGISKAHDRCQLIQALIEACKYDRKIIIEEFIDGRELECSVLGNNDPVFMGVGEILPSHEFYDYEAKYFDGDNSKLLIPAQISDKKLQEIKELSLKAFKAVDCCGMARIDLFMEKDTCNLYINEINTIPGFTRISMYPKLCENAGLKYNELIDKLIDLAIERYKEKN